MFDYERVILDEPFQETSIRDHMGTISPADWLLHILSYIWFYGGLSIKQVGSSWTESWTNGTIRWLIGGCSGFYYLIYGTVVKYCN